MEFMIDLRDARRLSNIQCCKRRAVQWA